MHTELPPFSNNLFPAATFIEGQGKSHPQSLFHAIGLQARGADGEILKPGDMAGQNSAILDILELQLAASGLALEHLVRVILFQSEEDRGGGAWYPVWQRLKQARSFPAVILLQADRLDHPDLRVEWEVTAVA